MEIAERIQSLLRERGLVQRRVAAEAGFSAQQMNDMLHGRKLILAEDLPRIAAAMGVSPAAFFEDTRRDDFILSAKYTRLAVEDVRTGKEIAVITGETVTTADDAIVVRLVPSGS